MDQFYNITDAETRLRTIADTRMPKHMQLQSFLTNESIHGNCQVSWTENSKCWKLIETVDNNVVEEVVLRTQGILSSKALPPIQYPFQIEPRQRPYFRQNISITGLGAQSFEESIASIQDISEMFGCQFSPGMMDEWKAGNFENHTAIDASCRYFTARTQALTDDIIPFSKTIDPDGILEGAICERYVHTTDNVVEYYQLVYTGNDGISYNTINPVKFRVGDIVEAQISFIAIPLRERRYKMLAVLRALTLLDDSPLRDATIARNHYKNNVVITATKSLKRKVGYTNNEVEEARMKLRNLNID